MFVEVSSSKDVLFDWSRHNPRSVSGICKCSSWAVLSRLKRNLVKKTEQESRLTWRNRSSDYKELTRMYCERDVCENVLSCVFDELAVLLMLCWAFPSKTSFCIKILSFRKMGVSSRALPEFKTLDFSGNNKYWVTREQAAISIASRSRAMASK